MFRRARFKALAVLGVITLLTLTLSGCGTGQTAQSAADVNGHGISMSAYDVEVTYMRHNTTESTQVDVCASKGYEGFCRKLKQTALNNLINEELVRQYASAHHIAVSPAEFQRQLAILWEAKFHQNNQVFHAFLASKGITARDLKGMIRQEILQNEVMYQITKNMPRFARHATELSRIVISGDRELNRIQGLLGKGTPFAVVAAQLSRNKQSLCAQQGCGELGWLPDSLVPPGEEQVITARPGTVVGPIAGQGGYALLLVEAHATHYPLTAPQDFAMRQRLFTQWLSQQEQHSSVQRNVTA